MPVNILYITSNITQQNNFKKIVVTNYGIDYHIIDDLNLLTTELKNNCYTHLILHDTIKNKVETDFLTNFKIPILIIGDEEFESKALPFSFSKQPLNYIKLFTFLIKYPIISENTLQKYAMGDKEFINQMKLHIIEEFKTNFELLPKLITDKNYTEIKNRAHKMVSKFSLLEMNDAFNLAKEIDLYIFDNPDKQVKNMQRLLVDIKIVLKQLN